MSALIRLYPAAWRARYGAEFEALLVDRPATLRDRVDVILGALDARLSPQLRSALVARRARTTDRLAGGAAIAGGLIWSATYLVGWLLKAEGDLSLPILIAVGLMLLSLPGTYVAAYARPVAIGAAAFALSIAVLAAELVPWSPLLLLPALGIIGAVGPGALALSAARAGIVARDRWRLLVLTLPWPVVGVAATFAGFVPTTVPTPLVVASFLPLGIAWIATGLRIARGQPSATIVTTGGAA